MDELKNLLISHEQWLMEKILDYAKQQGYTRYSSPLINAWQLSISGLSQAVIQAIDLLGDRLPEFSPDDTYTENPIARFGIIEAGRHRKRGIRLEMFLGLLKYYRQTYQDLIRKKIKDHETRYRCDLFIVRCFDLFELALCAEWNKVPEDRIIDELQKTNRDLTNDKNRYLTLFKSLSDPVFLVDAQGMIQNINPAGTDLIKAGKIPGHGDPGRFKGTVLETLLPWLSPVFSPPASPGLRPEPLEIKIRIDNRPKVFRVIRSGMLDLSGKFEGSVVVVTDITEQTRAQEALKLNEERLALALEATSDAIWDWNINRKKSFFSPRYYTMLGYDPGEFPPTREAWQSLVHPDDLERVESLIDRSHDLGKSFQVDFRLKTKTGQWKWILSRGKLVARDGFGRPVRMVGTHMDLTDRRLMEKALSKSEALFRGLFDNMGCGIALLDKTGIVRNANAFFTQMLGFQDSDSLIGQNYLKLLAPEFMGDARAVLQEFSGGEIKSNRADRLMQGKDKMKIWTDQGLSPIYNRKNEIDTIALVCTDISDRVRTRETLQEVSDRLTLATAAGGIGVWEWDVKKNKMVWDSRMMDIYKIKGRDFSGSFQDWKRRIHPEDTQETIQALDRAAREGGRFNGEFRIIRPNKTVRNIRGAALPQFNDNGLVIRMIGVNWDITDLKQMEEEIRILALTDPLTGANNRRSFMEQAETELARCKRYNHPLSTLMIDIDHFKDINDTFGHHMGDLALKLLTEICLTVLRENDLFGRVGGEEFSAVLVETKEKKGFQVAERLRKKLSRAVVSEDGQSFQFTVSIGIAELNEEDTKIEDALKKSDRALYRAKHLGRNRVVAASQLDPENKNIHS
ncbi:sensor domain-containing diguanylate cyclase [Desulfospira joergensenii]|uniref:sensor domain-containing diguanylate cyclase n=1 Tax=Desulfospira joergensenii TaxID=53329 RepID=UPI001377855F|nr:diguanylate cyclase [Desulfospira joergensenii]